MGPFTSGSAREIADPEAEVERLAAARKPSVPAVLCDHEFPVDHDSGSFWVKIRVTAEHNPGRGAGTEPWPFPVAADFGADLGRRIADMIRADCAT